MTKEQQDIAWAGLPKDARNQIISSYFCKRDSNTEYNKGYVDAILHIYGIHNLTSDTEPEEILLDALASQWRNVNHELPKTENEVLVAFNNEIIDIFPCFGIASYDSVIGRWLSDDDIVALNADRITDWMPIPELPKKMLK